MIPMKPVLLTVYADISALPDLRARHGSLLSDYRKERMARFREESAAFPGELAEYCLIEAMLRIDPNTALPLKIGAEENGKPYLVGGGAGFSVSHAGTFAAATVSDCEVGTDIERRRHVPESLAKRICTDREWEQVWRKDPSDETFLRLFSAKESIVKRSGEGVRSLAQVDTETYPVRQKFFSEYVLSVCSASEADWEVICICG